MNVVRSFFLVSLPAVTAPNQVGGGGLSQAGSCHWFPLLERGTWWSLHSCISDSHYASSTLAPHIDADYLVGERRYRVEQVDWDA